jgi:hypothetical protein
MFPKPKNWNGMKTFFSGNRGGGGGGGFRGRGTGERGLVRYYLNLDFQQQKQTLLELETIRH